MKKALITNIVLHLLLAAVLTYFFNQWYVFVVVFCTIFFDFFITKDGKFGFFTIEDGKKAVLRLNGTILFESERIPDEEEINFFDKIFLNPFCLCNVAFEDCTPDPHEIVLGDGDEVVETGDSDPLQVKLKVIVNLYKENFEKIEKAGKNDIFKMVLGDFENTMRILVQSKTFDEIKKMSDLSWDDLKREMSDKSLGNSHELFEQKLFKFGLGLDSVDVGSVTLKNEKTNEFKEKAAQQKLENEAKESNANDYAKRMNIAKIKSLIQFSELTLEECLTKTKGDVKNPSTYDKALVIAIKNAKKLGANQNVISKCISDAVHNLKVFEGQTTETVIVNSGKGPSAVPVHTIAASGKTK